MITAYFCSIIIYLIIVYKLLHLNNVKGIVKNKKFLVRPKLVKNNFNLFNLKITVNGYKLKNFNRAYGNSGVKFYKTTENFKVIISINCCNVSFKFYNIKSFNFVYFNACKFKVDLSGLKCVKHRCCYNNFKQVLIVNSGNMQNSKFAFNIKLLNTIQSTMQLKNNTKKNSRILNQKIIGLNIKNNAVIIKNYKQNLQNIFNFKINDLIEYAGKIIINKTYILKIKKNLIYVSKMGFKFDFDFNKLFNFKLNSNNVWLNNLVNNFLPNRVLNEYINSFSFLPFNKFFVPSNSVNNYYYKTEIKQFLLKKQYINCYNYILFYVLGVWCNNQAFLLNKPKFYLGNYTIYYNQNKLLVYNNVKSFFVKYNGIEYKNFSNIKLQTNLIDNNIDKLK